jgi:cytochrome P450
MAVDIPEDQRLSDEEILARKSASSPRPISSTDLGLLEIPTFMVAGHETTSTGTTWALFALTQNQTAQRKLREELLAVPTDTPTMDELQALPYLDAVVRETLRVHAPVSGTMRVPEHDDVIPLSEPITDKQGVSHSEIRYHR